VLLDVDRRVRERLEYFLVNEQHRASVVLNDLVIVLQCVGKDLEARIRAADTYITPGRSIRSSRSSRLFLNVSRALSVT
jgi:hypothetical protein